MSVTYRAALEDALGRVCLTCPAYWTRPEAEPCISCQYIPGTITGDRWHSCKPAAAAVREAARECC